MPRFSALARDGLADPNAPRQWQPVELPHLPSHAFYAPVISSRRYKGDQDGLSVESGQQSWDKMNGRMLQPNYLPTTPNFSITSNRRFGDSVFAPPESLTPNSSPCTGTWGTQSCNAKKPQAGVRR